MYIIMWSSNGKDLPFYGISSGPKMETLTCFIKDTSDFVIKIQPLNNILHLMSHYYTNIHYQAWSLYHIPTKHQNHLTWLHTLHYTPSNIRVQLVQCNEDQGSLMKRERECLDQTIEPKHHPIASLHPFPVFYFEHNYTPKMLIRR